MELPRVSPIQGWGNSSWGEEIDDRRALGVGSGLLFVDEHAQARTTTCTQTRSCFSPTHPALTFFHFPFFSR